MYAMPHYIMRLNVIDFLGFYANYNDETKVITMSKTKFNEPDRHITDDEIKTLPLGKFCERIGISMESWDKTCDAAKADDAKYIRGQVYLSRRNLEVLLSKLDRKQSGDYSACTIIKINNKPSFPNGPTDEIAVMAVEDEEYYKEAKPGFMHPLDTPKAKDSFNTESLN